MVANALEARQVRGLRLIDVGCGTGGLWRHLSGRFEQYWGLDAVRYDGFPGNATFCAVDLDSEAWPTLPAGSGDVVAALETIEHLENPWAFVRRLVPLARPGGWIVISTPNQLSLLSLLTLVGRKRFSAFQDVHYPVHRTALLPSDLCRAAGDCGIESTAIEYSLHGRIPLTPWHYPRSLAGLLPSALSDNVMVIGRVRRG
jgi:2-polyprenyl-3-methyl-5-hydroxy-6-metoxy-1,4-benzoquinol methylase